LRQVRDFIVDLAQMKPLSERPFQKIIGMIGGSRDLSELNIVLKKIVDAYGLSHAVHHVLGSPNGMHSVPVATITKEWERHYITRRYHKFDPIVQFANQTTLPFDWSAVDRTAPAYKGLYMESIDAGIGKEGLTIPFTSRSGHYTIFSVNSNNPDWRKTSASTMRDMQYIGDALHARVLSIRGDLGKPHPTRQLNQVELDCLQWASEGKTIEQTAGSIGQTERSVRFYLERARVKLGCLTKTQAVAVAIRLGVID
jgi:DNA-binding CsgD family transcriptional regulator